jgi:CAP-Gly domain/CLIP1 zinc knuckle
MDPRVGDTVDVPGGMHGTVKFVGEVAGKKGKFAGVQLAAEFAVRGKNSGDVDGKHYFKTTKAGSGIFLPVEKAIRRGPATPTTPSLTPFNQGGRTPVLPKPNFSQSIGPGARAASPALKPTMRRPSLQRPGSPLRGTPAKPPPKLATPSSRPSLGPGAKPKVGTASRYGQSPIARPSNFGASLRGASSTPLRSPLGPEPSFDEEEESTPTPTPAPTKTIDHTMKDEEIRRLKDGLDEKDRQLKEQAATLTDMEKSLSELQSLLPPDYESIDHSRSPAAESGDIALLKNTIREKNEKISMLIAEFDAHRADFRSTIDTLEMASTETERVYEKRVDELLEEVRHLQYRGEDVDGVVQQLKQLEELVQELEEGLEDARRGEAEARGEVEFLRGEVERGRSELKREKGKAAAAAREDSGGDSSRDLEAKDNEIRGLKALIHSLSENEKQPSTSGSVNGLGHHVDEEQTSRLEDRVKELESLLAQKASREEETQRELERLRSTSTNSDASTSHKRSNTIGSHRLSDRTIVPGDWREQKAHGAPQPAQAQLETMHEADTRSTATDSSALWCEICETAGHDILGCTNMFAAGQQQSKSGDSTTKASDDDLAREQSHDEIAPLKPRTTTTAPTVTSPPANGPPPHPPPTAMLPSPPVKPVEPAQQPKQQPPNPNDQGMVAGKGSGVIDEEKWCALCERDGHESVDCPFEDAF